MSFLCRQGAFSALVIFCLVLSMGRTPPSFTAQTLSQSQDEASAAQLSATRAEEPQPVNAETLFAILLADAENGQPEAMLTVGTLYEQGIGVPRNLTKALEWYSKAANAGERTAWMRLGVCYEIGIGTATNMNKALAAYTRSADLGLAVAQHKLARIYLRGHGVVKDENKGLDLLFKAADGGEPAAMYDLGHILQSGMYGNKAEPEKARAWFARAADAGHVGAILSLASLLKTGMNGKPDPEEALRWYLIGQKAGINNESLDSAIRELREKLPESKAREAEKAADAWVDAKAKVLAGQAQ